MSMPSRSKRQVLAGVVAVAALTLTGCGNPGPGVAAKVGDETVTVADVDRLTDGYCKSLEEQITAQGQVVPMRLVRTFVAGSLTLKAAAEQFAAENGITVPDGYPDRVKEVETQSQGLPAAHRDDFVEVGSARAYVTALEHQVGAQLLLNEGTPDANDDQKVSRGREELVVWLGEHGVDVNPRYGFEIKDGNIVDVANDTSYPLSENAVAAGEFNSDAGPDQTYSASLPASQRCG
jgi:peptidyl-prolyl cis-trans isomerase SurA